MTARRLKLYHVQTTKTAPNTPRTSRHVPAIRLHLKTEKKGNPIRSWTCLMSCTTSYDITYISYNVHISCLISHVTPNSLFSKKKSKARPRNWASVESLLPRPLHCLLPPTHPFDSTERQLQGRHADGRGRREAELGGVKLEEPEVVDRIPVDLEKDGVPSGHTTCGPWRPVGGERERRSGRMEKHQQMMDLGWERARLVC